MLFDPKLQIGQIISNSELAEIFKCGNMGGMRRSYTRHLNSGETKSFNYAVCMERQLLQIDEVAD